MNFLAPWFLLGGLAIAAPIVFHLIRRVARERVPFSTIQFLRPTPPKVTRRRRVEHFWLLFLRCLCLLLLAAAFARPFFSKNAALPVIEAETRQLVLLLDTSASLQREGLWNQARAAAVRQLDRLAPGDQAAIVTFDRQPGVVIGFSEWNAWSPSERSARGRERLNALKPGWGPTQLGRALTEAAELLRNEALAGNAASIREVVLISDLQEGAKLDGLQGFEWPAGVRVAVEPAVAKRGGNAGLTVTVDAKRADEAPVAVRVVNAKDSKQEHFQLRWQAGGGAQQTDAYVAPGQGRVLNAPAFPAGTRTLQAALSGDPEPFDNAAYAVVPAAEHLRIAWLGTEAANDPEKMRYYFERVFPQSARRRVEVAAVGNNEPISEARLNDVSFAVTTRALNVDEANVLREWIGRGETALMVLADDTLAPTLAAVTGVVGLRVSEAGGRHALLGQIDFQHPLFAPFADPRFSDFTRIHFWRHRRIDLPTGEMARVLARFDDGSPALLQFAVGEGTLLVLAAGWNPSDSQLALSSKFPPLIQTVLAWSGASTPSRLQFQCGDAIASPVKEGGAVSWKSPDGRVTSLPAGTPFTDTSQPGFYTAIAETDRKERVFAVNVPADEIRTTPMPVDLLARMGVPLRGSAQPVLAKKQESLRQLQRAELENRQKLWRWLIVAALTAVFAEMLLSGWLARRALTESRKQVDAGSEAEPRKQEEFA